MAHNTKVFNNAKSGAYPTIDATFLYIALYYFAPKNYYLLHDLLGLDSTVAHHLLHDVDALVSLHNAAAVQVEDSD